MRLPGFTAEAGVNRQRQKYNPAGTFAIAAPRAAVEMANIISGGCNSNAPCGTYNCTDVWDTCQYYAAATSHSGADVSNCCSWWVSCCEFHPPSSGGGGGSNGGPPRHRGPVAQ
jgi:hypothetical protein